MQRLYICLNTAYFPNIIDMNSKSKMFSTNHTDDLKTVRIITFLFFSCWPSSLFCNYDKYGFFFFLTSENSYFLTFILLLIMPFPLCHGILHNMYISFFSNKLDHTVLECVIRNTMTLNFILRPKNDSK